MVEDLTEASTAPRYWFAGASYGGSDDQTERFIANGIWENGYDDRFTDVVRSVKPGDRIAIKSSFVRKHDLPFANNNIPVGTMRIKAVGTVVRNHGDGKGLDVKWEADYKRRDWFFYVYRQTITSADLEQPAARALVAFAFEGQAQDYDWFLNQEYWSNKFRINRAAVAPPVSAIVIDNIDSELDDAQSAYTLDDIVADGCFLPRERLQAIFARWSAKKNLILQGPPGTGKTWLAKRLGFVLVGSSDRELTRSRLRIVQFHPSLAYEDFVRGWRPDGAGSLVLKDGILMECIEAALSEPDTPFVLIIEEINRGNPAQIFGEMLTLLEDSKRNSSESMELAYYKHPGERIYVPENLFLIGTMNVADRTLAIVDLALRRRFAFEDLEPTLSDAWFQWCVERNLEPSLLHEIRVKIEELNNEIVAAVSLGPQYRIGHSFITPQAPLRDGRQWFYDKIETEIGPLLDEYWYDAPTTARAAREKLMV